jgi:hypothetical protein
MNPMKLFTALTLLGIGLSSIGTASAASVVLTPTLDTSIYSEGDASNALGALFAGRNKGGGIRRTLMQFDVVGSAIPAGSVINSVTLTMAQLKAGGDVTPADQFELHPVLKPWGEGTSTGTGQGGSATPGDATWNFQIFNTTAWTNPGGDIGSVSGTVSLGTTNQSYTFSSQAGMVADVQQWLDSPSANFGWMLRATTESGGNTAREFGSSEFGTAPSLTINYTAVPEPGALGLLATFVGLGLSKRKRAQSAAKA